MAGGAGAGHLPNYPKRWAVGRAPCSHIAVGCTHSHPAEQRPAALAASISANSVNTTCLLLTMHSSQALGWLLLLNTAGSSISRVNYHSEVVDACVPSAGPALTACSRVAMLRPALAREDARGVRWHVWGMPGSLGQANCTLGKSAFQVRSPVGATTASRGGGFPMLSWCTG